MKEKSTALLDIEKIVKASEDTQMKGQFLAKNAQPLKRLANKLGISKEQATLFAIIAYSSYCSILRARIHPKLLVERYGDRETRNGQPQLRHIHSAIRLDIQGKGREGYLV